MMRVRVAFIGEINYPSHNIRWINHLVEKESVEGIVITRSNQNGDHLSSSVSVFKSLEPFPYFNPVRKIGYLKKLRSLLNQQKVDVIHFLWGVDDCVMGPMLQLPFLITTRGSDVFRDLNNHYLKPKLGFSKRSLSDYFKSRLHRSCYRQAFAVTSTSKGQQAVLAKFQPDIQRKVLARTGVYLHPSSDVINDKSSEEQIVVFSPRTMRPLYNQHIILDAFAKFIEDYPSAQLRMIDNTNGSAWSLHIRKLVEELELNNQVTLLPSLSHEGMNEEYSRATLCVMIPETDGVPVTALEAMINETPILVGDNDYDLDFFNDQTVWQIEKNEPSKLYAKMVEFAQTPGTLIGQKIQSAKKAVMDFGDRNKEMKKIVALYYNAINHEVPQ